MLFELGKRFVAPEFVARAELVTVPTRSRAVPGILSVADELGTSMLAAQVMKVIYAAYYSDEEGRRIDLV